MREMRKMQKELDRFLVEHGDSGFGKTAEVQLKDLIYTNAMRERTEIKNKRIKLEELKNDNKKQ